MSAIPYMPLYIADYMADTAHLTTLENGAYLLLIMTYWQSGKPLRTLNGRLANVARLSNEDWTRVEPTLREFFQVEGDLWVHARIERELARFRAKSDQASNAGRASAKRRFNGRSTDVQRPLNHTDTDTDKESVSENAIEPLDVKVAENEEVQSHGVIVNCETIRHKSGAFTISLPAIDLAIAGRLDRETVKARCLAHALQWGAEIEAGKRVRDVLPDKIANFLSASLMGEINRDAVADARKTRASTAPSGRPTKPVKKTLTDVMAERRIAEAAAAAVAKTQAQLKVAQ